MIPFEWLYLAHECWLTGLLSKDELLQLWKLRGSVWERCRVDHWGPRRDPAQANIRINLQETIDFCLRMIWAPSFSAPKKNSNKNKSKTSNWPSGWGCFCLAICSVASAAPFAPSISNCSCKHQNNGVKPGDFGHDLVVWVFENFENPKRFL